MLSSLSLQTPAGLVDLAPSGALRLRLSRSVCPHANHPQIREWSARSGASATDAVSTMAEKRNWSQIRNDTDTGKTGDKVNFPDPATVPLGTDEEAGGSSTSPDEIAESERRRSVTHPNKERPGSRYLILSALLFVMALIGLFILL